MRVSEFVGKSVDSHDLAALVPIIDGLITECGASLEETHSDGATLAIGDKLCRLYGATFGQFEKTQGVDKVGPKGVTLGSDVDRSKLAVAGYGLASMLARQLAGEAPGDSKLGRGFAFRANMEALRQAGF